MSRFALGALGALALALVSTPISAQQVVPPAAPTIGASGGIGAGIAAPAGNLRETHAAGYTASGLVDFSAAEQPFSFRLELIYQRYDAKSAAPAGTRALNMTSLGASLLARSPTGASSGFVLGGIGVYRMTDRGTKPGLNVGMGLEVPLTFFIGIADVRFHFVLTDPKPTMTIPITLGARF